MNVTAVIADDEAIVRAGITMILGGTGDITVVGEAADGLAAFQAAQTLAPDVVLLDIRMPGLDGLDALTRIRALPNPPAVVMLTAFDTEAFVTTALEAGACGFLLKTSPPEQLVAAVHAAAAGEMPFSPEVLRRVVALAVRSGARGDDPLDGLSDREREVALAVAEGLTNAEIAERLFLSIATVKTYVNRLFEKAAVTNRVQLALKVERARRG